MFITQVFLINIGNFKGKEQLEKGGTTRSPYGSTTGRQVHAAEMAVVGGGGSSVPNGCWAAVAAMVNLLWPVLRPVVVRHS